MSQDALDGLAAWRAARSARRQAISDYAYEKVAALPERDCEHCGYPYAPAPRPGGRPQRYCSRKRQDAAHLATQLVDREHLAAPPGIRDLPALPEPVRLGGLCVQPGAKPVWTSDDKDDRALAKRICMVCSVRIPYCRDWALQLPAGHGDRTIYAGMYGHERQAAKTAAAASS